MQNDFVKGQWDANCDRCGFTYKSGKLRREWTGLMTCSGASTNNCFDPRHPQESVKGKVDKQTPPWVRPEPPDLFIDPTILQDWDDL